MPTPGSTPNICTERHRPTGWSSAFTVSENALDDMEPVRAAVAAAYPDADIYLPLQSYGGRRFPLMPRQDCRRRWQVFTAALKDSPAVLARSAIPPRHLNDALPRHATKQSLTSCSWFTEYEIAVLGRRRSRARSRRPARRRKVDRSHVRWRPATAIFRWRRSSSLRFAPARSPG